MIKIVRLIGAGAVGSYFIWGLSEKNGLDFALIAEGERKERLEKNGVKINGKTFHPKVLSPEESEKADLVLISVKYGSIREAAEITSRIINDNSIVISLLNGVDSEEIIAREIGWERIVMSLMKIVAFRSDEGVTFNPNVTRGIIFGERNTKEITARMIKIKEVFDNTGINYTLSKDIITDMWTKYIINVSRNLPQAILSVGAGSYDESEHVKFISASLRNEVIKVAAAKGIDLSNVDYKVVVTTAEQKRDRYSTLQDLDNKRHTEIDTLALALVNMGKEVGVETPFALGAYHYIKALEEKNDGMFDY